MKVSLLQQSLSKKFQQSCSIFPQFHHDFLKILSVAAVEEQSNSNQSQTIAIDIDSMNITDEEKEQMKISHEGACSIRPETSDRPFLDTVLSALDCSENDYLALLGLCLIYALAHNKGKYNHFVASKIENCEKRSVFGLNSTKERFEERKKGKSSVNVVFNVSSSVLI